MTLSKNKIKYIQSLKDKKHRSEHQTFVAEGDKMISELLHSIKCQLLVCTEEFIITESQKSNIEELIRVDVESLNKASFLKTPQHSLAVFYQPQYTQENSTDNQLCLALDGIQDPGNLGTIVRLADWYGIENIFCSKDTADIYNPKTVQATMGALARVKIHYVDLEEFLTQKAISMPIYGTLLDGNNMYEENIQANGIIVMGNEGNGIRPEIEKLVSHKLYIPNYPSERATSESLNVAIATAIICSEFRRRCFIN